MKAARWDRENIARTLQSLTAETLFIDASKVTLDAELSSFGADSLQLVELAMAIEDAFGIDVSEKDQLALRTLADAVTLIEARLQGQDPVFAFAPTQPNVPAVSNIPAYVPRRVTNSERVRVVITGVGAITPVGVDAASTFDALLLGQSGAGVTHVVGEDYDVRIAAEIKGFDAAAKLGDKLAHRHARFTHLACVAAIEAARDAGLAQSGYASSRIGTILGVGMGGIERFAQDLQLLLAHGPEKISPYAVTGLVPNMAPAVVAMLLQAHGPSFSVGSACASGGHALATSLDLLRAGRVDAVVTGGAEACVTREAIVSFSRMGALSRRNDAPEKASRPFDKARDGFVLGEGAGVLVLETLGQARARGAKIYAELAGVGASADAFHEAMPDEDGRGAELAMRAALDDAQIDPAQIGYINAHATGTPAGDVAEARAIVRTFGERAKSICVGATKSMTGHLLGAAGGVEAIITAMAIARGVVPPTINCEDQDPLCALDAITEGARSVDLQAAMSNTFAFGGQNASIVLRRVD